MDEMRETVGFTVNFVYFQMVKKEQFERSCAVENKEEKNLKVNHLVNGDHLEIH